MMQLFILTLYTFLLSIIFVYSLSQLHLLLNFFKWKKSSKPTLPQFDFSIPSEIPYVTIQLPIYNEQLVALRLIKQVSQLTYPTEKLEIQVLDDSTDCSAQANKTCVAELQQKGIPIVYLHRTHRKGFKAGALKEGLQVAKGEYIVIFDADFLPQHNWLYQTIPYFKNPKVGVVQTRWGHLNQAYSLMTKVQAFALDFHFTVEQIGRNAGQHFINFNGTAGVWRKACILDAGNWQGDTLTEDLDLSYRAQLKGWQFAYLWNISTPAELPIAMGAARSQQFRWNKGAAENFQKNFNTLRQNKNQNWLTKLHGFFHLLNSSLFVVILLLGLLSVPTLYIKAAHPEWQWWFYVLAGLGISTLIFILSYGAAYRLIAGKKANVFEFIGLFISFFSIAMGMSVNNSIAVLEGHFGKKSAFVRTPKFNSIHKNKVVPKTIFSQPQMSWQVAIELLLLFYFMFGMYSAFTLADFGLFPFHLMLSFGFGYVVFTSLFQQN